jgi:hypothetical protein
VLATKVHGRMHDGPGGQGLSRKAIQEPGYEPAPRATSSLSTSARIGDGLNPLTMR